MELRKDEQSAELRPAVKSPSRTSLKNALKNMMGLDSEKWSPPQGPARAGGPPVLYPRLGAFLLSSPALPCPHFLLRCQFGVDFAIHFLYLNIHSYVYIDIAEIHFLMRWHYVCILSDQLTFIWRTSFRSLGEILHVRPLAPHICVDHNLIKSSSNDGHLGCSYFFSFLKLFQQCYSQHLYKHIPFCTSFLISRVDS